MTNEELVSQIKVGIDTATNMLVLYEQNKGIICRIAKKYSGMAELEDLTQEGYIGLCRAVDNYEPAAGASFSTYAYKVIQSHLLRYIRKEKNLPEYLQSMIGQYRQLENAFMLRYGRKPLDGEYCRYLKIVPVQLKRIKKSLNMMQQTSLNAPMGEDETILADILASDTDMESEILDKVHREEKTVILLEAMAVLPDETAEIIKKRYWGNMTRQQIGDSMGMTSEQARQHEEKGMRRLRTNEKILSLQDEYVAAEAIQGTGAERFNRTWTSATERVALRLID